jgi:predicted DNA-binding transcriptional regulator AlpA
MSRSAAKAMTRRAAAVMAPPPEDRYVNRQQLRVLVPASDMTVWRWVRDPEVAFPAPVKLGADGRNYWWLPKVREWMRRREERSAQTSVMRTPEGNTEEQSITLGHYELHPTER